MEGRASIEKVCRRRVAVWGKCEGMKNCAKEGCSVRRCEGWGGTELGKGARCVDVRAWRNLGGGTGKSRQM